MRVSRGGARSFVAPRRDPEGQDRELSPLSADAVECESARRIWHSGAIRRCGPKHAHLRGKRAGQVQRHRHHASGAELRSVPAVWCPHVPRKWEGAGDKAFADVRLTALSWRCCWTGSGWSFRNAIGGLREGTPALAPGLKGRIVADVKDFRERVQQIG